MFCLCVCSVVSESLRLHGLYPAMLLCPWNSSGKNSRVGCHFLLQWIFLAQELICLSCVSCIGRWILYPLSHLGSPIFYFTLYLSGSFLD